jgi:hypothetical protein
MFDRFDDRTLEVATVIVVVVIALVILCYLAIYINPYVIFNPFPPPTPEPTQEVAAASTVTVETWTDTPTPTDTATPTPTGTWTPTPTPTNTSTPTPMPYFAFGPTASGPAGGRPDCEATWVDGYVLGANGLPEPDVQMRVGNDDGWQEFAYTNVDGYYAFKFWDGPLADKFYVQVFKGGVARSMQYWWETSAGCESPYAIQYIRVDWRHTQ